MNQKSREKKVSFWSNNVSNSMKTIRCSKSKPSSNWRAQSNKESLESIFDKEKKEFECIEKKLLPCPEMISENRQVLEQSGSELPSPPGQPTRIKIGVKGGHG